MVFDNRITTMENINWTTVVVIIAAVGVALWLRYWLTRPAALNTGAGGGGGNTSLAPADSDSETVKVDLFTKWLIVLITVGILLVGSSIIFRYEVTLLWPYSLTLMSLLIGKINGNAGQVLIKTSLVLLIGSLVKIIVQVFFDNNLENIGGWYWLPFSVVSVLFIDINGITPGKVAASWLFGLLLPFSLKRGPYMNVPGISQNIAIPNTPQTTRIYKPDDVNDSGMEFFVKYDKVVASLIGISASEMMSDTDEVKEKLRKLNYVRGSLLPCHSRITYQWEVVDVLKALSFLNVKWGTEVKWEEEAKKFETPMLSFVKAYLRPTINGTDFDDLLEKETQDRINGILDPVDASKNAKEREELCILNQKLIDLLGVRIITFNLEKATRNDEIERLIESVSKESFQRIQELKDADTQAELTKFVIQDVLGYDPGTKWKDLEVSVRTEVSQRVLQIQDKLTAGDTAIANAVRGFFDRTGVVLSPKEDQDNQKKGRKNKKQGP